MLDRVPEIGMLRQIGATGAQLITSVVVESGFLGPSSVVCGVLSGVGLGYILPRIISRRPDGWTLA